MQIVSYDVVFAITQLKNRYLRCLDTKQWDELASLFTDDATTSYGDGEYSFQGPEQIAGFLKKALGVPGCISVHRAIQPEFDQVADDEVHVTWCLSDRVIYLQYDVQIEGAAYYHDTYRLVDGEWKIAAMGYERQYEQRFSRSKPGEITMTANRYPLEEDQ